MLALGAAVLTGCKNQEAPPETLKPIVVGPVELYGMTLGPQATPQQVTYALMQALRETVKAGQHYEREAAKKQIEVELQLCAAARIYHNVFASTGTPESITPRDRDAMVYKIVKVWAPIAARYVDSFTPDAAKAIAAMRVKRLNETDTRVSYDVVDPVDQTKVTFQVYLTQEAGSEPAHSAEKFWRVYRLGYAPFGRDDGRPGPAQTRPAATQPAAGAATTQPGR